MRSSRTIFLLILLAGLIGLVQQKAFQVAARANETFDYYLPLAVSPYNYSVFGLQVYNETVQSNKYYDAMVGSGATWLRAEAKWNTVEPQNTTPDQYSWVAVDRELAAARPDHGGYDMVVTILAAPDWAASSPDGRIDKVPLSELAEFVGALVERYDGDGVDDAPDGPVVRHWEFYNEPDHSFRWGHYPQEYAAMLASVYPAVKAANPSALVVFGGVAYDWFEDQGGPFVEDFIYQVFAQPGGDQWDVMSFHAYSAFAADWASRGVGLLEKAAFIRAHMPADLAWRPFMITEAGWCSSACTSSKPTSEAYQARYVVALFSQSLAADIKVMIWWLLYDLDPVDAGNLYAFGLVTDANPPVEKLAFKAFRTMTNHMAQAQFERAWTKAETGHTMVEFYQFHDASCGCKRYVGWLDPLETSATATVLVPHGQVQVYESINGALVGTLKDGDDGTVDGKTRVTVTGAPRYFEGR